jgi:hypothetical protein
MPWTGGVGSGNLVLGSGETIAAPIGSFGMVFTGSLTVASGYIVQTAANVGGSAAAIVGSPEFYVQVSFRGTDYLMPLYRKV